MYIVSMQRSVSFLGNRPLAVGHLHMHLYQMRVLNHWLLPMFKEASIRNKKRSFSVKNNVDFLDSDYYTIFVSTYTIIHAQSYINSF